jgi:hypothetical protein
VYALNAYPDERTIIIPLFAVVSAVISASAWLAVGLRRSNLIPDPWEKPVMRRALQAGILAILILGAGYSIWQTAALAPDYQAYARAWDQRAMAIEQAVDAGERDLTVAGLDARFGVADLNESPDHWVNRCMANYYRLRSLSGR